MCIIFLRHQLCGWRQSHSNRSLKKTIRYVSWIFNDSDCIMRLFVFFIMLATYMLIDTLIKKKLRNKTEEKNDSDEKMHINLCLYSLMSLMFYFIRIFQTLSFILFISFNSLYKCTHNTHVSWLRLMWTLKQLTNWASSRMNDWIIEQK